MTTPIFTILFIFLTSSSLLTSFPLSTSPPLLLIYIIIYQGMNTDTVSSREGRYNAVFHLVTAAEGAEKYYSLGQLLLSLPPALPRSLFPSPILSPSVPLFLTLYYPALTHPAFPLFSLVLFSSTSYLPLI